MRVVGTCGSQKKWVSLAALPCWLRTSVFWEIWLHEQPCESESFPSTSVPYQSHSTLAEVLHHLIHFLQPQIWGDSSAGKSRTLLFAEDPSSTPATSIWRPAQTDGQTERHVHVCAHTHTQFTHTKSKYIFIMKSYLWASKMDQWAKDPEGKLEALNLILGHVGWKERAHSWPQYAHCPHSHTQHTSRGTCMKPL